MRASLLSLTLLSTLFLLPGRAAADTVTWESGTLSGTVSLGPVYVGMPATVSGGFTINAGADGVQGLDYSAASPGSLNLQVSPFSFIWSGTFSAPTVSPLFTFTVSMGTFTTSVAGLNIMIGDVFDLTGDLASITPLPPLDPFPASLTDPFVSAHITVTQVYFFGGPVAFDFSGTYEARATQAAVVPEPASLGLLAAGLAALRRRRRARGIR